MQPSADEIDQSIRCFTQGRRLGNFSFALTFPAALEFAFGNETAQDRVSELRLTIPVGMLFYYATTVTDPVFTADLGWGGLGLRLLGAPLLILAPAIAPSLTSVARERLVAASAIAALLALTLVSVASDSPSAAFSYATVCLALIYANTTFPLRFHHACLTTAICCAAVIGGICTSHHLAKGMMLALGLQAVVASLFSLIANYRIERSLRLNYLLAAKERQRLADLAADREVLTALSQTDRLTGLANRVQWELRSAALLGDASNRGLPVGLLMIDVDYFKRYNDHYGHNVGDVCLQTIANALSGALRGKDDLAVRYGGEEFIVLLPNVTAEKTNAIAQHLRRAVAVCGLEHANRDDGIRIVTISIGVAHSTVGDGSTIVEWLEKADRALYVAKDLGRNRVEVLRPVAA
jgi:diguanylate cyclase (GGDEF)-like protein